MKNKTIRQFINELEKMAQKQGDDIHVKPRITMAYLPITKHYHTPLIKIEKPKTEPQVVIVP